MCTPRQEYQRRAFFGKDNYHNCRNNFVRYKSILNPDEFILQTNNIERRISKDNTAYWILAVDRDMGVFIPAFNVVSSAYIDTDGKSKRTHLVKIKRNYFHVHKVLEPFDIEFEAPDSYSSLFTEAEIQQKQKRMVKMV